MDPKYKVIFDELEWIEPGDGIRYKRYQHDGSQLRLIECNSSMKHEDWCLTGHIGFVVQGRLQIGFADHVEIYETGDALFIPEGEAHKHRPKALTSKVTFFTVEKT